MAPRHWLCGVLGLAWASLAEAGLLLAWEFPHTLGPQRWFLTVVAITTETPSLETRPLETLDDASCRRQLGQTYVAGQSWCAPLPCLPSGAYQVVLQAEETSRPSEPLAVGIQTPPCAVVDFDEALTVAVPVRLPPPVALAPPPQAPRPGAPPETTPVTTAVPGPVSQGPPAPVSQGPSAPTPRAPTPVAAPRPPPVPTPAPTPVLFGDEAVPARSANDATTSEQFVQAFAHLAQRYGEAMDPLVAEYNAVYDAVVAHPTPAGQRRLQQAYEQAVRRQQQLYTQATQAWERLYAAWQQFVLTPAQASHPPARRSP